MNPGVGDIWEWTAERWDHAKKEYYDFKYAVLILTEPELVYDDDDSRWDFDALELDGDTSGVVESWSMYNRDTNVWRRLA